MRTATLWQTPRVRRRNATCVWRITDSTSRGEWRWCRLVGVEQKVTPRIQEQFDEEMQGIGQAYPVLLEHEGPIEIER
jgi:hypothetical protein